MRAAKTVISMNEGLFSCDSFLKQLASRDGDEEALRKIKEMIVEEGIERLPVADSMKYFVSLYP